MTVMEEWERDCLCAEREIRRVEARLPNPFKGTPNLPLPPFSTCIHLHNHPNLAFYMLNTTVDPRLKLLEIRPDYTPPSLDFEACP